MFYPLFAGAILVGGALGSDPAGPPLPVVNSFNVSTCPGYSLHSLSETDSGLTARLNLAGPACNAFGVDIADLTIEVNYETETRYAF